MAVDLTLLNSNSLTNIQTNFDRVEAALQKTLGRTGDAPNSMGVDIDMNGNDVLNVGRIDVQEFYMDGSPIISIPSIGEVVAIAQEIIDVAAISSEVVVVANNISSINAVASDLTNINTVATNIDSVNTVATNITNVNLVGNNTANINTVIANLTDIQNADDNALLAKNWASKPTGLVDGVSKSALQYAQDAATAAAAVSGFITTPALRLTLISNVAVMSSSVAGATTVYATPFAGSSVPLYNGTSMNMVSIPQLSLLTTDTTKSPAAVVASSVYDVFVWDDAGTKRISRGPAWSTTTTRGYTLTDINGILVNTSSITNGPAAQRGTWLGTIASNASSTIDFVFGAGASGGSAANLMICNAYNRVPVLAKVSDTGAGYTYASATIRQARASVGNQINFIQANGDLPISISYSTVAVSSATANAAPTNGIGYDTKIAFSLPYSVAQNNNGAVATTNSLGNNGFISPSLGIHFIAGLEQCPTAVADTFNAQSNNALMATLWL